MIDTLAATKAAEIAGGFSPTSYLSTPVDSYLHKLGDLFDPVEGEFDPSGQVLSEITSKVEADIHIHHMAVQKASDEAADAVLPLIHLTRNMVVPDYRTVVEEVDTYMSTRHQDISDTLGYTITYRERCLLTTTSNVAEGVKRYSDIVGTNVQPHALVLDTLTKEDVAKALSTTVDAVNAHVAVELDEHWPQIHALLLGNTALLGALTPSALAIVFLYAQYIYDAPVSGLGVSLDNYNATVKELTEQSGRKLYYYIDQWEAAVVRGRLYTEPRNGNEIIVNGEVYRAACAKGLSAEMVLANERLGRKWMLTQEMLDDGAELARIFEAERNTLRVAFDNDSNNEMRVGLLAAMTRLIQSKEADAIPTDMDTLIDTVRNRVAQLTHNEIADLACTVRDLVCDVLYPHTGAKTLLVSADHIGAEQPDIDPREAFAFAVAEYIAKWFSSQLIVR